MIANNFFLNHSRGSLSEVVLVNELSKPSVKEEEVKASGTTEKSPESPKVYNNTQLCVIYIQSMNIYNIIYTCMYMIANTLLVDRSRGERTANATLQCGTNSKQ